LGWLKFGCKFSSKWLSFGCHSTRYGLPETLPLDWQSFAQAMPDVIKPMLIANPVTPTNLTT
jgi:hypothetical protein